MNRREDKAELRWRADENFREMFRILARGAPSGAVLEQGQACFIATGAPVPLFNPAFAPPAGEITAFLAGARGFYRQRGVPWALVEAEHAPGAPPGRLRDAGLFPSQTLPALIHAASPGDDWPVGSGEIDIRAADTPEAVAHHRALLALGFGIPDHISRAALPEAPPTPLLRLYVAYKQGEPVGSAALCEAAGLAGIYNVASHPRHRRAGIGTALMRRVLEEARERGIGTCVLQSSAAGEPLYARLRFERLSAYTIYTDG